MFICKIAENFFIRFDLIYKYTTEIVLIVILCIAEHVFIHQSALTNNSKCYIVTCKMVHKFCVQFDLTYICMRVFSPNVEHSINDQSKILNVVMLWNNICQVLCMYLTFSTHKNWEFIQHKERQFIFTKNSFFRYTYLSSFSNAFQQSSTMFLLHCEIYKTPVDR